MVVGDVVSRWCIKPGGHSQDLTVANLREQVWEWALKPSAPATTVDDVVRRFAIRYGHRATAVA